MKRDAQSWGKYIFEPWLEKHVNKNSYIISQPFTSKLRKIFGREVISVGAGQDFCR